MWVRHYTPRNQKSGVRLLAKRYPDLRSASGYLVRLLQMATSRGVKLLNSVSPLTTSYTELGLTKPATSWIHHNIYTTQST